ncbi:unnamed protein product [Cyclocybe aegerita]|uniref:Uncharacterized protein n=1 Tax=Cyclocybe aegerita TaxID=1973307 RepID=A0A8S0WW73_CYCAE|nr:unnamed protein product [Cyclocybe aegerita]
MRTTTSERFQLYIAISNASLALLAVLTLRVSLSRKVYLPTGFSLEERDEPQADKDPFDITDRDDFVDGFPVHRTTSFWAQMYRRNWAFISLQTTAAGVWCYSILNGCILQTCGQKTLCVNVLQLFAAACFLSVSVYSTLDGPKHHSTCITQLSFVLTIKVLTAGVLGILPSSHHGDQSAWTMGNADAWNVDLALAMISWLIVTTSPRAPALHYPEEKIYSPEFLASASKFPENNVSGETVTSFLGTLFFTYATDVFMLGRSNQLLTFDKLPILPASLRAVVNFSEMKQAMRLVQLPFARFRRPGTGYQLGYRLIIINFKLLALLQFLAVLTSALYYGPIVFIQEFLRYLERDPQRADSSWGWFYVAGIFIAYFALILANAQLWSISSNNLKTSISLQLNTILYAKTLVRKDVPSNSNGIALGNSSPGNFSSKAEVMTLMTADVNRVREIARLSFSLTDAFIGIGIATYMLYDLMGSSAFVALGVASLLAPMNHIAGRLVFVYQESVMKCRDERVGLTNELLGAIRMIKFMARERSFEKRVLDVRSRELTFQKRIFWLTTLWTSLGNAISLLIGVACFAHFSIVRGEELTPAIAFTSIVIFAELRYPLTELPEFFIEAVQAFVSLRRIEGYLNLADVQPLRKPVNPRDDSRVSLRNATISWPQICSTADGEEQSYSSRRGLFSLVDVTTTFPRDEISLICGKIGSGKTLLLLGLLGEADVMSGEVSCPRSAPNSHDILAQVDKMDNWILDGACAYVPQTPWLRNRSLKENILFSLPYDAERYSAVLRACALIQDIEMLEAGDETDIGEQGVNLSGGQKARVSLARAVYSRASILLLDDVLSAVDTHTAGHLWNECFKGNLIRGRTVILVSHHIQLCGPDTKHILALENGRVQYSGSWNGFKGSSIMKTVVNYTQTQDTTLTDSMEDGAISLARDKLIDPPHPNSENGSEIKTRKPRKEENRFEGHVSKTVWLLYARSNGGLLFWLSFWIVLILGSLSPVWENGWLRIWSSAPETSRKPGFYVGIYAALVFLEIFIRVLGWLLIFSGAIRASKSLYERLLEVVLFASLRFHDTTSRGWLLNRVGKDFEAVDNDLPKELGRVLIIGLSLMVTMSSLTFVGGWPFLATASALFGVAYFVGQIFGHVARDLRRLSSITSSPLFALYGESISGLTVIRAFGMSTKFLRDMIICADTNMNPYYWSAGLHRWLTVRFQLGTAVLIGLIAAISLVTPSVDASLAGLALAFASTLSLELYWFVRRSVEVQQHMISLERIKEYSDLPAEPAEFIEPRPAAVWPMSGFIQCENLTVRYAPELPDVLHHLTFSIQPGEKIGLVGRTGSGKSTVGLSLMRFVEAREGRVLIDGVDISHIGVTDLRRRLTVVPQDPVLLSGTLRTTLDVFGEYDDADIYDALRRVNLIGPHETQASSRLGSRDSNVFANLDGPVSELGDNFSTGEKQLLCLARALLRRSKVLIMDEATASVDYVTDEIISKTIREEFSDSTIITIAHRLRTVVDYDKIMVMEEGNIVEFDRPEVLLQDQHSRFHQLCKASGLEEFANLKSMVGTISKENRSLLEDK